MKSFIDDYNDVVKEAGESNTKDVLRNASWMTGMTDKTSHLLSKIGITIGKGNKLELDEDELKKADISSLKTVLQVTIPLQAKQPRKQLVYQMLRTAQVRLIQTMVHILKRFLSNVK